MRRGGLPEERFRDARILVIDDEESNVRLLRGILEKGGYRSVLTATDPDVGARLAITARPDLVLLDLKMPRRDGFNILRELAEHETGEAYIPVLVLSATTDPDQRRRALATGAEDFLPKPFDVHEVLLRCRNLLETRFLYQDLSDHSRQLAQMLAARSTELALAKDAHQNLLASLARLHPAPTAEGTAAAVCEELVERGGFESAVILAFVSADVVVPLASRGALARLEQVGRPLPRARARYLRERAAQGPWAEADGLGMDDGRFVHTESPTASASLYAPLGSENELLGLVTVAAGPPTPVDEFVRRLPTIVDHATIARALLTPSLRARRLQAASRRQIARIIDRTAFMPVFQPIVDLGDRSVLGFEALTRFDDETRPDIRFAEADVLGLGTELQESCLRSAIAASHALPGSTWLSLNVSAELLLDPERLESLIAGLDRPVVFEVTEHEPVEEYATLRESMDRLSAPTQFAIDDVGAGFASFRHIVELRPDYVKLDLALVRSIETDPMRQALVTGLRYFAERSGCTLIAEGVETEAERGALSELGVVFGQGYLLGMPAAPSRIAA